ncbi:MAG: hypothetical protein K6T55_00475 [Syntrophobacterales bacterium]|nr:hypothetical protein [Syntrophobacterales bacterium]
MVQVGSVRTPTEEQLREHYQRVKEIIQAEDFWERVPEKAREFSPENLENLVKYAYFAGFIDMRQVLQLLFLTKKDRAPLLQKWYEQIREAGCWLC